MLGNFGVTVLDEYFFDQVLNLFDGRDVVRRHLLFHQCDDLLGESFGGLAVVAAHRHRRAVDRVCDALWRERHNRARALDDLRKSGHAHPPKS